MKKILVDTNIVLDVLLSREPWLSASSAIWAAVENGQVKGYLAAHAVTTIFYMVSRSEGAESARQILSEVLRDFHVAAVNDPIIRRAAMDSWSDFEDGVTTEAAIAARCDFIVTRNPADFARSPLPVLMPEAALLRIGLL